MLVAPFLLALGFQGETTLDFEASPPATLTSYEENGWSVAADEGHAELRGDFAKNGTQCLRLFGGAERMVTLTPPNAFTSEVVLRFDAERWTQRAPFSFHIDGFTNGEWVALHDASDLRVGARFLSSVHCAVPAGTARLRLRCSSADGGGALIDSVEVTPATPMRLTEVVQHAPVHPVLLGEPVSPVVGIRLTVRGHLEPQTLRSVAFEWDGPAAELGAFYTASTTFDAKRPFGTRRGSTLTFDGELDLTPGTHMVWLGVTVPETTPLTKPITARALDVSLADGTRHDVRESNPIARRVGSMVRNAGQDGVHTYRIPALVTTPSGVLVAAYDIRHRSSRDLPGDVDVGVSRSFDGGRTWQPMQVAMDFGEGEAWSYDGVGDPCLLMDPTRNRLWLAALWSHGERGWHGSGPGLTPEETGQWVLSFSDDDGATWSTPSSITPQVKDPAWRLFLQGPGRGICLDDGTLVFPAQFRSADGEPTGGRPWSTVLVSRDGGESWTCGTGARDDTTEAQVVALRDGRLLLNARDNRGGSRAVLTTSDFGQSWQEHPSHRSALIEPVCMASLLRVDHADYGTLHLFSNPASTRGRVDMTLKVSRDEGMTWPPSQQELYDARPGYGYSCLTLVSPNCVGVLYERTGSLAFLSFELSDLLGERP